MNRPDLAQIHHCCTQAIDYASIHLWPDNWERTDLDFARFWLLNHTAQATTLQKPLVIEEFGKEVNSSGSGALCCSPCTVLSDACLAVH